ncbi:MAG: tRNA lysidine(34) synthetase TilS [Verrucomicrobiia bacterium]
MTSRAVQRKSKSGAGPGTASVLAVRLLQAVKRCREANADVEGIAVAVSGGLDSMVLAEALHRTGVRFTVLHFNHRWRGASSRQDLLWVKRWAEARGLPFVSGRSARPGVVGENEARESRWRFFYDGCKEAGCGQLWLAQHADDLVETFLLQLMRGAGPEGMASLRAVRVKHGVRVVRPLLEFSKGELKQIAKGWGLEWREDPTNEWMTQFRNRVRLKLVPFMEEIAGRPVREPIWRAARVLADENEYWEELLPASWPEKVSCGLKLKPVAHQRRYLRGWLKAQGVPGVGFELIESVRSLLTDLHKSKVNLPGDRHCRRRAGYLFIE